MSKRQSWADIMRGIGIISVVFGHIYDGYVHEFIFMFHMPLFFFLGGYFFRPIEGERAFIKRQLSILLMPYICFGIVLYFSFNLIPQLINHQPISYVELILKPLIGGKALVGALGVFWFISCYFFLKVGSNFLFLRFNKITLDIIALVFFVLSFVNSVYYPNFWLPGNLNVVLAAFPIFYIGYEFHQLKISFNKFLILSFSLIAIISLFFVPINTYDMKYVEYGIPVLTLISSLALILLIKEFSHWISRFNYSQIFKSLGKASMVIMYVHLPIKILLYKYLIVNSFLLTITTIVISYLTYLLLDNFLLTRRYFMGHSLKNSN